MKFIVSSSSLLSHLQIVGRVIASKNSLPILDCFLFELQEQTLHITAADAETRMLTSIDVSGVEGSGLVAIPARNLLDSLKELPDQPVVFDINEENLEIKVSYENGKCNFMAQKGEEYPQAKVLSETATQLSMAASTLLSGISRTIFASADDELRPVMNGVFFDITTENITIVASDGHMMVRYKALAAQGTEKASFILPKKPANLLKNILPKEAGDVSIAFDESNAYIKLDNFFLICRLVEGRYPNYNAVIPVDNPYKVSVDRQLFLNALKRVSVFSNSATSLIKLDISSQEILISAQDIDFSTSASETVSCINQGQEMIIGFKGTDLINIFNNIPSSEAVFELADASRAGLILPSENEASEDLLMLLMPMMLND
ncbi:DNA polymerase III subunit beta [Bacteroidales bacterium]|nr:DNA polymerase III subunit beta [Bacteroidales bacterium]